MDQERDVQPPGPSLDALLPLEIARSAEQIGVNKAQQPAMRLTVLGVLAGAFIGFGAVFSTAVTSGGSTPAGISRIIGGVAFSLGLILVVVAGAELFTGNNLMVMALAGGRIKLTSLLRAWTIVYFANFAGAVGVAAIVFFSGHTERGHGIGTRALDIATAKSTLGFGEAILLGVLANVLVCLAIWLALSARSVTDKIVAIVFPITAFVASGFEHSIANMYFMPAGLFLKSWASTSFWAESGTSPDQYADLTWKAFFVDNLLPVTIGNVIGGAILVGLVYWFVYLRNSGTRGG